MPEVGLDVGSILWSNRIGNRILRFQFVIGRKEGGGGGGNLRSANLENLLGYSNHVIFGIG